MLSRISATVVRRTAARFMSTEVAVASKMTLSFALPHETIYNAAQVESVILPGTEGEYGVTADHVPAVSELAPGVVQIDHGDGETEKYFIAGGFAFTHPDSHTVCTVTGIRKY
jgi:F-type H+-transporting ATPase subunit delta